MNNRILLGWSIGCRSTVGHDLNTEMHYLITDASRVGLGVDYFSKNFHKAKIFVCFQALMKTYRELLNKKIIPFDKENITIIKMYSDYEEIDLSEDIYRLEIQKNAVKKLEVDEIYCLGIEQIAAFAKLDDKSNNFLKDFYPNENIL